MNRTKTMRRIPEIVPPPSPLGISCTRSLKNKKSGRGELFELFCQKKGEKNLNNLACVTYRDVETNFLGRSSVSG